MVAAHSGYVDSIMVDLLIGLGDSIIDIFPVHDELWPQRFGIAVLVDHNRRALSCMIRF